MLEIFETTTQYINTQITTTKTSIGKVVEPLFKKKRMYHYFTEESLKRNKEARYWLGFITARGVMRDKLTLVLRVDAGELKRVEDLVFFLKIKQKTTTLKNQDGFIIVTMRSSGLISSLQDSLYPKDQSMIMIWGQPIRAWGIWPQNKDDDFVTGYWDGMNGIGKGAKVIPDHEFELKEYSQDK